MEQSSTIPAGKTRSISSLTQHWGEWDTVSLYLDRCQVDTPRHLVEATWAHVAEARQSVENVVDFGAGDGRFADFGRYGTYTGYEIDLDRCEGATLPPNAKLINKCAFSDVIDSADLCIGNPPFVRNQDLPSGWREHAAEVLKRRAGIAISGLANAWQYFFLLSLISTSKTGLVALVVPFEGVSRPSVNILRQYIKDSGWGVRVYRLVDETFESVLTTSSITIVDKRDQSGRWSFFSETADGSFEELATPSGCDTGVARYLRRAEHSPGSPRATRGLSPGTQKVLTLTEGERVRLGLKADRDVVPCVTSLRTVPDHLRVLDRVAFQRYFRDAGRKCWLIQTDVEPSEQLAAYLASVPPEMRATKTCLEREEWWRFTFPDAPQVIVSQSFRGGFPKCVENSVKARAVGGIAGVNGLASDQVNQLTERLGGIDISDRVVAHSNGLRKIEINQLNGLMADWFGRASKRMRTHG